MITKSWNEIIGAVGRSDDQLAFSRYNRLVINCEVDNVRVDWSLLFDWVNNRHADTPTAVTGIVTRFFTRASNSLLNNVKAECTGAKAEGPTKQIVVIL